jgi:hypothetical protein
MACISNNLSHMLIIKFLKFLFFRNFLKKTLFLSLSVRDRGKDLFFLVWMILVSDDRVNSTQRYKVLKVFCDMTTWIHVV